MQTSNKLDPKSLLGFKLQAQTVASQKQSAATGAKVGKKPPSPGVVLGTKVGKKPPAVGVAVGAKIGKVKPEA